MLAATRAPWAPRGPAASPCSSDFKKLLSLSNENWRPLTARGAFWRMYFVDDQVASLAHPSPGTLSILRRDHLKPALSTFQARPALLPHHWTSRTVPRVSPKLRPSPGVPPLPALEVPSPFCFFDRRGFRPRVWSCGLCLPASGFFHVTQCPPGSSPVSPRTGPPASSHWVGPCPMLAPPTGRRWTLSLSHVTRAVPSAAVTLFPEAQSRIDGRQPCLGFREDPAHLHQGGADLVPPVLDQGSLPPPPWWPGPAVPPQGGHTPRTRHQHVQETCPPHPVMAAPSPRPRPSLNLGVPRWVKGSRERVPRAPRGSLQSWRRTRPVMGGRTSPGEISRAQGQEPACPCSSGNPREPISWGGGWRGSAQGLGRHRAGRGQQAWGPRRRTPAQRCPQPRPR